MMDAASTLLQDYVAVHPRIW